MVFAGRARVGVRLRWRRPLALLAAAALTPAALSACSAAATPTRGVVSVVAAENTYGDVAAQIGGRYVRVDSVVSNPNVDPHTYELTPRVAEAVSGAGLVVQNGLGYDAFMAKVEAATPNRHRQVLDVGRLLGLPATTFNPHVWYDPRTMPAVAAAVGSALGRLDPAHAAYFRANVARFDRSLQPWRTAIAAFRAAHHGVTAATTEPVADDLLSAMGIGNRTPAAVQADIMNGTDPSPQQVAQQAGLLSGHQVRLLAYNEQVVDSLTQSFRHTAARAGIPVVGVYETMPTPGFDYQTWMLAETRAIARAVDAGASTGRL